MVEIGAFYSNIDQIYVSYFVDYISLVAIKMYSTNTNIVTEICPGYTL